MKVRYGPSKDRGASGRNALHGCRSRRTHRVPSCAAALVLVDDMTALDECGPNETIWRMPGLSLEIVSSSRTSVRARAGVGFVPSKMFGELPNADVLVVPSGPGRSAVTEGSPAFAYVTAVGRRAHLGWPCLRGRIDIGTGRDGWWRISEHPLAQCKARFWDGRLRTLEPSHCRWSIDCSNGATAGIDVGITLAWPLTDVKAHAVQPGAKYVPELAYPASITAAATLAIQVRLEALRSVWFGSDLGRKEDSATDRVRELPT